AIGHADPVALERPARELEIVGAHLMPEAARARVDHEGHVPRGEAEPLRGPRVVDLVHDLHLEEVVARAEGAELPPAALARAERHAIGIGAVEPALRLDVDEVRGVAVARLDRPRGAPRDDSLARPRAPRERATRLDARPA